MLILESTDRLTANTSLHRFSAPRTELEAVRPSHFIAIQLPGDLDPIGGARNLSDADRYLYFTPCQVEPTGIVLLSKHGRVTGLLGLPRPNGPLTAVLSETGGGFDPRIEGRKVCVAGGTGIACFTSMQSATGKDTLLVSIRGEDFDLVTALMDRKVLRPDCWEEIKIFITSGGGQSIAGRSNDWWTRRLAEVSLPQNVTCHLGRMGRDDLPSDRTVLFCGGKSLEWQVKMWCLNGAAVYTTRRT